MWRTLPRGGAGLLSAATLEDRMRFHVLARIAAPAAWLVCGACAPATPAAAPTSGSAGGVGGPIHPAADPAAESARFVPVVTPRETLGAEPGGGVRAIENGVRVVALPGGAILAASDRFPGPPTQVLALPERLGGGFLFVVGGTTIWRAERWLGPARVLYVSSTRIGRAVGSRIVPGLVPGLDRVYLQTEHEIWRAIDGVRGVELPLGPWPASPSVGSFVAADGWRAVAAADLRGTVATFDAGATWRPLHQPPDERETRLLADAEEAATLGAVGETPAPKGAVDAEHGERARADTTPGAGPLGGRPLGAAVEDGWPLDDGTAIVARDGVLARVRMSDGAIQSVDPAAYPLRPSRCHAMPLGARGGLGFACGEPRGRTVVYALDTTRGRMIEDRRFDSPRVVLPSGSGAVSVRGSCDARETAEDAGTHAYCVRGRDGEWRETRLTGAIGGESAPGKAAERVSAPIRERLVALDDGRLALVWPPSDMAAARLMLIDGAAVRSVPIRFPELSPDVRRALEEGLWLDGFEERRAGVLGGWIASGGSMLGVEIGLDGAARFGAYVRDAGARIVSGPYGLAWSRGHVGLETTDGGMTWAPIDGPAPIDEAPPMAACGPVGCEVGGWLRVGWREPGAPEVASTPPGSSREAHAQVRPLVALACEGLGAAAKGRDPLGAFATPTTTSEETRYTFHAPDLREGRDVDTRIAALGRAVAWGPKGSDWDRSARWSVQWASPFAGAEEAHTTVASPAPALFTGIARVGTSSALQWSVAAGDDPVHALLLAQGNGRDAPAVGVFELEADHTPSLVHGPENAPLGHVDAALRAGGHWYLASHVQPTESIVWRVDGAYAREVVRIPRWFERGRSGAPAPRLAWRTDGRALGFVVDAGPTLEHRGMTRWVAPIDLETGAVGDVELLGAADLGDAETLTACTADDAGWSMDAPLAGSFPVEGASEPALLSSVVARVRLGGPHPCLERVAGRLSPSRLSPGKKTEPARASGPTLNVTTTRDDERDARSLRCVVRSTGRGAEVPSSSRQLPSK
jgi:hypothetical protein